jgi:hypothetical protein
VAGQDELVADWGGLVAGLDEPGAGWAVLVAGWDALSAGWGALVAGFHGPAAGDLPSLYQAARRAIAAPEGESPGWQAGAETAEQPESCPA